METANDESAERLPTWMFVALPVAYSLFLLVVESILGLRYTQVAASTFNLARWIVFPLSAAGVLLVVLTLRSGLWRAALRDETPLGGRFLAIPAMLLAAELIAVPWGVLGKLGAGYILVAALATAIVGFNEELIFRGVLLVGLRERTTERWAFLISTSAFAAVHGLNFIFGLPLPVAAFQMASAFLTGSVLYMARRATGSIIAPMALHAGWDFWAFLLQGALFAKVASVRSLSALPVATVAVMIGLAIFTIVIVASDRLPGPAVSR